MMKKKKFLDGEKGYSKSLGCGKINAKDRSAFALLI